MKSLFINHHRQCWIRRTQHGDNIKRNQYIASAPVYKWKHRCLKLHFVRMISRRNHKINNLFRLLAIVRSSLRAHVRAFAACAAIVNNRERPSNEVWFLLCYEQQQCLTLRRTNRFSNQIIHTYVRMPRVNTIHHSNPCTLTPSFDSFSLDISIIVELQIESLLRATITQQ